MSAKSIAVDLFKEQLLANCKTRMIKSKATLKPNVIIAFSWKNFEYQHYIRNSQIERAKKYN